MIDTEGGGLGGWGGGDQGLPGDRCLRHFGPSLPANLLPSRPGVGGTKEAEVKGRLEGESRIPELEIHFGE